MKKIISFLIVLTVLNLFTSFADDMPTRVVHDNSAGQTAKITITAEVVKLLTIESNVLIMSIGPLAAGQTKVLGSDYNAVFHLNGVPNAKFVINLIDESYNSNGVTLDGVNWEYRKTPIEDYTKILSFPFISQLNPENGDAWIRVFPESITAKESVAAETVYFEFKFNCSYYEL